MAAQRQFTPSIHVYRKQHNDGFVGFGSDLQTFDFSLLLSKGTNLTGFHKKGGTPPLTKLTKVADEGGS